MALSESIKSFFNKEKGQAIVQLGGNSTSTLLTADDNNHSARVEMLLKYKRAYERVPLIRAIIDTKVDQTVQDFHFVGDNKEECEEFSNETNLPLVVHGIDKSRRIYGDAFVEYSESDGEKELKIINPIWMVVYRSETGDEIGFGQIINDKKKILWGTTGNLKEDQVFEKRVSNTKNILHFKHNCLISDTYGRSDLEPLMHPLQTKLNIEEDLGKVVNKHIAPLIWAKVGTNEMPANQSVVSNISNTLKNLQAESQITTTHLVDLQVLAFNGKGMDIKTPIEHIENQIITGGHVPPVLLGRGGADKAQAEVQLRNFGRHIKAGQRELKFDIEDKIIVGLGIGGNDDEIVWAHAEEREWESYVDLLRGLVTDGIVTPQKANGLLPPQYQEELPEIDPLNQNAVGPDGLQIPRANQMKNDKVKDNPNNPQRTTKNPKSTGRRIDRAAKEE